MLSVTCSAPSAPSTRVRNPHRIILPILLATLAGCGPADCTRFIGRWQGQYVLSPQQKGEVELVLRPDFALTVIADRQTSGGSWSCKSRDEVVLNDRASVPMSLLWLAEGNAKIPANTEHGRPEVLFRKQVGRN